MMSMESEHQFLVPTGHLYMPMDEQLLLVKGGGGGGAAAGAGKAGEKKRRFTEEQTRSLESMFHAHRARLEPREKAELARELGLQPRQVAIWFQNKRARWRSKQLEQDYAALRAQYDGLRARVDALKQEKLALSAQLQELSEKLKEREERAGTDGGSSASTSSNGEEVEDKRNIGCVMEQDSVLDCVTPADLSVESECDDHLDYGGTFPETFCATPELWEPWPLVEWNAVA